MAERWRRPVIPLHIDISETETISFSDGRTFVRPVLFLKDEDIERIRSGYVCAVCLEPHERPWPEHCNLCKRPIRRDQSAYVAREYGGAVHLGAVTSLADEAASLPERLHKEESNGSDHPNGNGSR